MSPDSRIVPGQRFRRHYDAAQFRIDVWNELKYGAAELERAVHARSPAVERLRQEVYQTLETLDQLERYFAFPGCRVCRNLRRYAERGWHGSLARQTARIVRLLVSDAYRRRSPGEMLRNDAADSDGLDEPRDAFELPLGGERRPYFDVLLVDDISVDEELDVRRRLLAMRRDEDDFIYDAVVVNTLEDGVIATLFNANIQACVARYRFPFASRTQLFELKRYVENSRIEHLREVAEHDPTAALAEAVKTVRPEVDLFLVTDDAISDVTGHTGHDFRRIFYQHEDYLELHLSILRGVQERYDTPFFTALRHYSQKPTGVFHAMPISRGKSIGKSHWIRDMGEFYGPNVFLAETSATTGGLDSLLQPHGPLRQAQAKMARAFGSQRSYFVTNGTSTANKIVLQSLVRPGDIVLVSRDCHKSQHYSLVLSGAHPIYMDPYPLENYSMYGGVKLSTIVEHLKALAEAGQLHRVRMLLLTNCTFDGIVYDPLRVMRTVLAIKPDMVFVWDEAWFAFARCSQTHRTRTAMHAARALRDELSSQSYRERYLAQQSAAGNGQEPQLASGLLPDPDLARVRVYATQSTHKTLTALRQGSMIHIYDEDFEKLAEHAFVEAFMTHTSTSPNYQILASLDVGRRQVELEGYALVKESVELAMTLRERITEHPLLSKWFEVLSIGDLIPEDCRPSGLTAFYTTEEGFQRLESAWDHDEFALDPTRVTLFVGRTGLDGDSFRKLLHERYDIQINKTSRNTALFMVNIGTTRSTVAYLLEVLLEVANDLEEHTLHQSEADAALGARRVDRLTNDCPPLPDFSRFHRAFDAEATSTHEGDIRGAFFLGCDESKCEHARLGPELSAAVEGGRSVVSAGFVTPYPPGFPILVPGQIVTREILDYLGALDATEIHGYHPAHGLRVFTAEALGEAQPEASQPPEVARRLEAAK